MFEKTTTSVKNFVSRHKTGLTIAATATVCFVIHRSIVKDWNEFLTENGLTDLYYTPEEA